MHALGDLAFAAGARQQNAQQEQDFGAFTAARGPSLGPRGAYRNNLDRAALVNIAPREHTAFKWAPHRQFEQQLFEIPHYVMDTMYKLAKFTYFTTVFMDSRICACMHMPSDLQKSLLQAIANHRGSIGLLTWSSPICHDV